MPVVPVVVKQQQFGVIVCGHGTTKHHAMTMNDAVPMNDTVTMNDAVPFRAGLFVVT